MFFNAWLGKHSAHSLVEFSWREWYAAERDLMRFRDGSNPWRHLLQPPCQDHFDNTSDRWTARSCFKSLFILWYYILCLSYLFLINSSIFKLTYKSLVPTLFASSSTWQFFKYLKTAYMSSTMSSLLPDKQTPFLQIYHEGIIGLIVSAAFPCVH